MRYEKIYVDMDGVLADFNRHFAATHGLLPTEYEAQYGAVRFWEAVYEDPRFFSSMPPTLNCYEIIDMCREHTERIIILSSPSRANQSLCVQQKREWIDTFFGGHFPAIFEKKKEIYAAPDRLLIDDTESKINRWVDAGGVGHLYKSINSLSEFLEKAA